VKLNILSRISVVTPCESDEDFIEIKCSHYEIGCFKATKQGHPVSIQLCVISYT
jgi:hypothetical protein